MTVQTYLIVAGLIDLIVGFALGRAIGRVPGRLMALLLTSAGIAFDAISTFVLIADLAIGTGRPDAALAAVFFYSVTNAGLSLGAMLFCWIGAMLKPNLRPF